NMMLLLRGSNMGQSGQFAAPATGISYLKIGDATNETSFIANNLVGANTTTYTSTTTDNAIVPWILGDTSGTGTGNTFVTYVGNGGNGVGNTGPGFIALAATNYETAIPPVNSNSNVRLTGTSTTTVSS